MHTLKNLIFTLICILLGWVLIQGNHTAASEAHIELDWVTVEAPTKEKNPQYKFPEMKPTVDSESIERSLAKQKVKEGCKDGCCGIRLNTDFPFIGKCIGVTADNGNGATQIDAFPRLAGWLMKLIITIIMVISVLMIVAAGVMMTTGGYDKSNYTKGVTWIKAVAQAMALLWASGVILKLINPNFFR